jgi:WD40 repeat protein
MFTGMAATSSVSPAKVASTAGSARSVAFTADGHTLATGSRDRTVRLWNVTDPSRPRQIGGPLTGHTDDVTSVAFTADGRTLASGSYDQTVRLWQAR